MVYEDKMHFGDDNEEQEQACSVAQSQQQSGCVPIPATTWAREVSSQQQGVPERLLGRLSRADEEPREDTATTPAAPAAAGTEQQPKRLTGKAWRLLEANLLSLCRGDDQHWLSEWEPSMQQVMADRCPRLYRYIDDLADVAVQCDNHFKCSKLADTLKQLWKHFGSELAVPGSPFEAFSKQLPSSAGFVSLSLDCKLRFMGVVSYK